VTPLAILQHVIVWLPLVVGGIFLIRAGLRGRRINDHPICGRCRFDLVGLAGSSADANSRPDRCPECGTSLTGTTRRARRAIIDGERRKRWRLFALGLVLLLSGLITGFWLSYKPLAKFPWTTWMPDWVLAEMVDSPNMARADAIIQELLRRIQSDYLGRSAANRVVEHALKAQADTVAPWKPSLGDLVEVARESGVVSEEQWARYARGAVIIDARARPVIAVGSRIPYEVFVECRTGNRQSPIPFGTGPFASGPPLGARLQAAPVRIDGVESRHATTTSLTIMQVRAIPRSRSMASSIDVPDIALGSHTVELPFDVRVFDPRLHDPGHLDAKSDASSLIVRFPVSLPVNFEIVASETALVSFTATSPDSKRTRGAFKATDIRVATERNNALILRGMVSVESPGVPCAFEVVGRYAARDGSISEVRLGDFACPADTRMSAFGINGEIDQPPQRGATLTLILRPSLDAAARTVDLTEIWGEEIIIENVPITIKDE
jgi:hypothetical protein